MPAPARLLASDPDPVVVAPLLLGMVLVSDSVDGPVSVRITEVEAYGSGDDPASHAHRGRTERNASMFGRPGTLYTYRSYGIHTCANVVVGPEGTGSAILVRAGVPVDGRGVMIARRGRDTHVADGPGRLCQALAIELAHDGLDLLDPTSPIRLEPGGPPGRVEETPRIGITKAVDRAWRFVAADGFRD